MDLVQFPDLKFDNCLQRCFVCKTGTIFSSNDKELFFKMNETADWADVLPNDKKLCERSTQWRGVAEKFAKVDEDEDLNLPIHPCLKFILDESVGQVQSDKESVSISEFEDNAADEDDFDVKDVLNQTKQAIKKRKESWNQSGFGYMLDTFTFDNIANRVDSWLTNNCDFFSSKFVRNSTRNNNNEKQSGEASIMEKNFDDFSDSSVDTAKYILSNRKRQKSKVTMTIKQFCFSTQKNVAAKQFQLEKIISGDYTIRDSTNKKYSNHNKLPNSSSTRKAITKKTDSHKRRQHSRTSSYSSSSTSSEEIRKALRRVNNKSKTSCKTICLTDTSSDDEGKQDSSKKFRKRRKHLKKISSSRKLPANSPGFQKNGKVHSKELSSDQFNDVSPTKKRKMIKIKHQSESESSDNEQLDPTCEFNKKEISQMNSGDEGFQRGATRKSNRIRGKSASPCKKLTDEFLTRNYHQCQNTIGKSGHKTSQLNNSSIKKSVHESGKQKSLKPIDLSRVSDNVQKNQGQERDSPKNLINKKAQVLMKRTLLGDRKPISRRRHTEINFISNGNLSATVSDLNLTHNGVINSTALRSQDSMIHCKENFESICNNMVESVNSPRKILQDNTISSCNSSIRKSSTPFLLYSPLVEKHPKRLSENGKVIITEKDLEDKLGSQLTNRFLGDQREFHYECHANSKLIFVPPTEEKSNPATSDSEEDTIDIMARIEKGEIIEIIQLNSVNRDE